MKKTLPPISSMITIIESIWSDSDTIKLVGQKAIVEEIYATYAAKFVDVRLISNFEVVTLHASEIGKVVPGVDKSARALHTHIQNHVKIIKVPAKRKRVLPIR